MSAAWTKVPLGELLNQKPPDVKVEPTVRYAFAGVYSFARGVFRAQDRMGAETSYRTLSQLSADDFVYPKLMAWEGAFGVVPPDCDGCYVSPEFPVFTIDRARVVPRWIDLYFKVQSHWQAISGGSIGTNVRRRRLHPEDLLQNAIPLPTLHEQRRIISRIEELTAKVEEARRLRALAHQESDAMISSQAARVLIELEQQHPTFPILTVLDFEGGSQPSKAVFRYEPTDGYVRFLQIRDFTSDNHLTFIPISGRNSMVHPHEVLVGRYGASLGKILRGKSGAYNVAMCKAVPIGPPLDQDFLAFQLSYGHFQTRLKEISRSAQAGFNKADLRTVNFTIPALTEQKRVVDRFAQFHDRLRDVMHFQEATAAELDAMLAAILDKAFKGEL